MAHYNPHRLFSRIVNMSRLLYTVIYACLLPAILLRLLWRSRLAPVYRQRWLERFGFFAAPTFSTSTQDRNNPVVWLHAVSVGETLAAAPLIKQLQKNYPQWQWVVTTTTPTGSERVRALFGDSVFHVYAPYDLPFFIRQFLQHTQPQLLIVMEAELWPNLLHCCHQKNITTVIANARLSEKSARGYKKIVPLTRTMLHDVSHIAAQQQADGERFVQLGLDRKKLTVTGSIKFDLDIDTSTQQKAALLREQWSNSNTRPVWLAASTHLGEDAVLLAAFAQLKKTFANLLLVLVPRHPERFDSVAQQCSAAGFSVVRRSNNTAPTRDTDIVLGDTMGELLAFYGAADIAFVGGSLVPVGGHNLIEPAAWACPIISGSHLFNFADIAKLLQENHALTLADNTDDIATVIAAWLNDDDARKNAGERAKTVADNNRGALNKLCDLIGKLEPTGRA
jgi:3-deoxy-D-manno-octulosonic-acid transferase